MDPTEQVYEADATGTQRGLYADVRETFRAPIVNSIWRTLVAHAPRFARYAWGQVKPVFGTRGFAAFSVAFRDRVLAATDGERPLYGPADTGVDPAAFTELRGQLATFDAVAPRLAVLFEVMDRRLHGRAVGTESGGAAATAPYPAWLDADRGRPPTMLGQEAAREAMPDALAGGFGAMVPSVYRCLAQWPSYLDRAWSDLEPLVGDEAFAEGRAAAMGLVDAYVDRLAYTPRVDPAALDGVGFDAETVKDLAELFATFNAGGEGVLPLLSTYAATVGAEGERDALTFP